MKKYIKIYSYKRVKVKKDFLDILHLEDLAEADLDGDTFKILSGKYAGKYINKFAKNFSQHDFCAQELTANELKLMTEGNEEISFDKYKSKCEYEYFIVFELKGAFLLKETSDEEIINAFSYVASPSVAEEFFSAIKGGNGDNFILDANLTSKLLGKKNSLTMQDPNQYKKKITDYNLLEKYEQLRMKIIGLDQELKILLANINKNTSLSYSSLPADKVKELKSGILILGPRGSGKTFMVESIADLFGVPSTIEDATRFTPAAYQGADIEDILIHLYMNSGERKEIFEHGIVFLDEIDKICKITDPKDYALKVSIQNSLLTILRGSIIHKKVRQGFTEQDITLDTSKLTFVLSGAFEEIIDKENITKEDLIEYGMIPQLADRINLFVRTHNPSKEELKSALVDGEYSYLKLFEEYLSLFNIPLEVDNDFIDYIVDKAYNSGSGYRALSTALTEYLNDILFDLYVGKMDVVKLSKKVGE